MSQEIHIKVVSYDVTYFATATSNAIGVDMNGHGDTMTRFNYACIFFQSLDECVILCFHRLDNIFLHNYVLYQIKITPNKDSVVTFAMIVSLLCYKGTAKKTTYFAIFRL